MRSCRTKGIDLTLAFARAVAQVCASCNECHGLLWQHYAPTVSSPKHCAALRSAAVLM